MQTYYILFLVIYAFLISNGIFFPLPPNYDERQEKGSIVNIRELNLQPSTVVMVKPNAIIDVKVGEQRTYQISDLDISDYKNLKPGDCIKLWTRKVKGGTFWENKRSVTRCA